MTQKYRSQSIAQDISGNPSGDYYVIVRSEEAFTITGTISVLLWKGATAMDKFGRTKDYGKDNKEEINFFKNIS